MGSLRFPFPLPQPPKPPNAPTLRQAAAAAAAVGAGVALAVSISSGSGASEPSHGEPSGHACTIWASLVSPDDGLPRANTLVEPIPGITFPTVLDERRRLVGTGVPLQRKGNVFGLDYYWLKNICYAYGVYADDNDIKRLSWKYGNFSISDLKKNEEFITDVLDQDIRLTVRLQIVYNRLSIGSVRNAFAKTVGSRIQKFSGSENKELLQSFTSLFKDEYKLPKGSIIDLSREEGYVLQIKIDGKKVGKIQSKLLCKSVFDLYLGEDPFDKRAKEDIQSGLASLLQGRSDE
ncbi:fatty-acid-binding protein 1 [Canna indica]|uniref:Chalcone--flavanone isomerase n=1 Tax=Canna indica TaxID=4628 RepID=A0AAQ3L1J4_9LILI|nr:fatty-acid-binding protein 1 [Canna indica]